MNNTVLVITAASVDAERLQQGLAAARDGPFDITWVTTLSEGLTRLRESPIDIVLADLFLPDSQGIATFNKLFLAAPGIPIMTLASEDDEPVAKEAVQRGAQGYLSKGHFQNSLVPQALSNIIHRKAVEDALFLEKDMVIVCRDEHETAIDMSVAPVHERGGRLSGALVVLHDSSAAQAATFAKMTHLTHYCSMTD